MKFRPSDLSEKRTFDCQAILVTIGGKGEWRFGEKRYALDQSGKVFFCNPGTELLYTSSDTQQGCSFYELSFRVYANYTGCLLALGVTPIIAKINPFIQRHFRSQLEGADVQTVDLLTFYYNKLIAKASPDLVLCYDSYEDLNELRRIAPTVAISLSSLSWRDQFILIAELVNAVGKAKEWLGRFDEKIALAKRLLEQKIDTTEIDWGK
ncbi:ABC transporter substrate-binding protein [Brevibacillus centrosporus]|uniref:Substrate-binding protein n=1 Tax=Brevibacillus centrosporus TaxID=54910 RepID=A0A1I3PDC1_9BACL|nr:ABC transporter substrate-binding protein [Brevibacillus centrosporus]SFJ19462.1 substrate-binding protein [Brevibacillus centrosporus]